MNKKPYAKLRGRIREICGTDSEFARLMGARQAAIAHKLNGRCRWFVSDVQKTIGVLGIDPKDIAEYFFADESLYIDKRDGREEVCDEQC